MLEVRLLGSFEIKHGKKTVSIPSRPAQSLFAFLILNAGTAYRREKLAGQLWPDSSEDSARDYLRHALWRIRKALQTVSSSGYLKADDLAISFDASADYWLDAASFQQVSEQASPDEFITALSAYKGELLPGFYDEWAVLEREHLQAKFEHEMGHLLDLLQEAGRWAAVLEWGEKWIALGQKPEAAYRALMNAHATNSEISKVAAVYERCVKSLREFGVEPSEQTRLLYEKLKAGKGLSWAESIPVRVEQHGRGLSNLPTPLTSFVGREKEIGEVARLMSERRLLTLTGTGGVGKTRLAIQVASKVRNKFKDGVFWVELAPISDPGLPPQAIARPLDVRESPNQDLIEALKRYLGSKKLLLILDNCEHLISACAHNVEVLTGACPDLKVLATSRETLGITGETWYEVPTLSVPGSQHPTPADLLPQYESIHLFVERARAAKVDFALTEVNAAPVIQICQQLDGIPLALELAAARTRVLSVEHIAARLDDRFNLLTQGSRTALPRQQTLRATVDWSYDLLPEDARILFQRLSVFVGGFTLEAAETICSEAPLTSRSVLDALARLVDRSLLKVEEREGQKRYSLLETIREYAREKLELSDETDRLRQRHSDFFVALAEQAKPQLKAEQQLEWLERLEVDQGNLRAAWEFSIDSDPGLAIELVSALLDFWHRRGNPSEGREWASKLLERCNSWGQTAKRARALAAAGWLAYQQNDFRSARSLLEESLAIARALGDARESAFALQWLGWTIAMGRQGDRIAQIYLEECLVVYQELHDEWGIAMALSHLGAVAMFRGHYVEGEENIVASLAIFRELGDKHSIGGMLNSLGEISRTRQDYERAGTYYEQARATFQELHSRTGAAIASGNLALVALHQGDYRKARVLLKESLELYQEHGNKVGVIICLVGFGGVLRTIGKTQKAAKLLGSIGALLKAAGMDEGLEPVDDMELAHYIEAVRGQLDEAAFAEAYGAGRDLTLEQAIAFALEETQV